MFGLLRLFCLLAPQLSSIGAVALDALAGRIAVWMDADCVVRIMRLQRTRVGGYDLVPAPEAPTEWQLVGGLVAAFGLTDAQPGPPRAQMRGSPDAPVVAPDLSACVSSESEAIRVEALPPWLAMGGGIFPIEGGPIDRAGVLKVRRTRRCSAL